MYRTLGIYSFQNFDWDVCITFLNLSAVSRVFQAHWGFEGTGYFQALCHIVAFYQRCSVEWQLWNCDALHAVASPLLWSQNNMAQNNCMISVSLKIYILPISKRSFITVQMKTCAWHMAFKVISQNRKTLNFLRKFYRPPPNQPLDMYDADLVSTFSCGMLNISPLKSSWKLLKSQRPFPG